MKTKIKKVYYCEFCKRHSLSSLISHELHCTMNPDRKCRLCGREKSLTPIIEKWKKIKEEIEREKGKFKEGIPGEIYEEIKSRIHFSKIQEDLTNFNCPICTFSIIRIVGLNRFPLRQNLILRKRWKRGGRRKTQTGIHTKGGD